MKPLHFADSDLVIQSDASLAGWEAHSSGISTGGPWSPEESRFHINYFELLAAFIALRAFTPHSFGITIHLFMDNSRAVSYINIGGGARSIDLTSLSPYRS